MTQPPDCHRGVEASPCFERHGTRDHVPIRGITQVICSLQIGVRRYCIRGDSKTRLGILLSAVLLPNEIPSVFVGEHHCVSRYRAAA